MFKLSICLLTYNSTRTLRDVIPPLMKIADDIVVVDSGSTDDTLSICLDFGLSVNYHPYISHGTQMNYAMALANNDWVLCIDSDEILDDKIVSSILSLKAGYTPSVYKAWRIPRYWYVLGQEVQTMYPISSPDFPVRLFNRTVAQFNDRPVDDQVIGHQNSTILSGHVRHDTFHSLHEVFSKMNTYTTRIVKHKDIRPSLSRAFISATGAFFKWYLFSGAWRQGRVGAATGIYATLYSFLKYFKSWYIYSSLKKNIKK